MNKVLFSTICLILFCVMVSAKGKLNEGGLVYKEYYKVTALWKADKAKAIIKYKEILKNGTKYEKEAVLNFFQKKNMPELVPSVIEAILDNTRSAPLGDTGWGRVYHHAATAMQQFAYRIDKIDLKERGNTKFSFSRDVGTASEERRKQVYNNWLKWWENNRK
jgi:hypothetical protein